MLQAILAIFNNSKFKLMQQAVAEYSIRFLGQPLVGVLILLSLTQIKTKLAKLTPFQYSSNRLPHLTLIKTLIVLSLFKPLIIPDKLQVELLQIHNMASNLPLDLVRTNSKLIVQYSWRASSLIQTRKPMMLIFSFPTKFENILQISNYYSVVIIYFNLIIVFIIKF